MGCNPPGSSVHRILQARILQWVAVSFSRDLPDPGIEPGSPALRADALPTEPPGNSKCTDWNTNLSHKHPHRSTQQYWLHSWAQWSVKRTHKISRRKDEQEEQRRGRTASVSLCPEASSLLALGTHREARQAKTDHAGLPWQSSG